MRTGTPPENAMMNARTLGALLAACIPALMFVPLFVQLDGHVYDGPADLTRDADVISLLPIPLSVAIAAITGLLLARFAIRCTACWVLFSTLAIMTLTSVVLAGTSVHPDKQKLIVIQFGVPMAGFVVGRFVDRLGASRERLALGIALVIALVVPLQLYSTFSGDSGPVLSPYVAGFAVYGHLQYVPTLLVAGYLAALFALWRQPRTPFLVTAGLALLAPLVGIYAAAALAMLAMVGLSVGLLAFAVWRFRGNRELASCGLFLMTIAATGVYVLNARSHSPAFDNKFAAGGTVSANAAGSTPESATVPPSAIPMPSAVSDQPPAMEVRPRPSLSPPAIPDGSGEPSTAGGAVPRPRTADLLIAFWGEESGFASRIPRNIAVRLGYWRVYAEAIFADASSFTLGQRLPPNRAWYPSAHNYYLDLAYQFGVFALLPILALIVVTGWLIGRTWKTTVSSGYLLGLVCAVLFLLVFDNGVRVSMRQLFSGTATFFLWGVLLTALEQAARKPPRPEPAGNASVRG